jgi:SNF2 family DNA or RNA helicase
MHAYVYNPQWRRVVLDDADVITVHAKVRSYAAPIFISAAYTCNAQWRRVVLDEAHVIANPKAKQSKAVMSLNAQRRWAVTGTPLQNKMDDLSSLFTFVRIEPLDDEVYYRFTTILY